MARSPRWRSFGGLAGSVDDRLLVETLHEGPEGLEFQTFTVGRCGEDPVRIDRATIFGNLLVSLLLAERIDPHEGSAQPLFPGGTNRATRLPGED